MLWYSAAMMLSETLTLRGFVHQSSAEKLSDVTDGAVRTVYLGVDPTADSIHVGNLAGYMLLRHFVDAGHKVIVLIGGGTGMIGDPKPDVERPLTPPEEVAARVQKLQIQARRLLGDIPVEFVNNHDWLGELNLINFLRDTGKHFTVNNLMKKDAIAERLKSEEGISYTEFAYPLLQAYDFWHLFIHRGCDVQIGGSDQWGNITAGVELIRRKEGKVAYALTLPLIVDKATGKKFGKSEGNAVWLDPLKTTPFQFLQFWLNASDESVGDYLKLFTLRTLADIEQLLITHSEAPQKRGAQRALAHAVTELVHGKPAADAALRTSEILFGDTDISSVTPVERDMLLGCAPQSVVELGTSLVDALEASKLASSKREARQFIEDGAVTVNGKKMTDVKHTVEDTDFVGTMALVKRGKRNAAIFVRA